MMEVLAACSFNGIQDPKGKIVKRRNAY